MLDLDSVRAELDHQIHIHQKCCKDAVQPAAVRPQPKQTQPKEHSAFSSKLQLSWPSWLLKSTPAGCDNLPPSSQGEITPCSSSDSTSQVVQLQNAPSGADVCAADVADVSPFAQTSSSTGRQRSSSLPGSRSSSSSSTANRKLEAATALLLGDSHAACSSAPGDRLQPQQQPRGLRATSSLLSACAVKASKGLKGLSMSALLKPAAAKQQQQQQQGSCKPLQRRRSSLHKLPWLLPQRSPKAPCQPAASLQPLSLSSRPAAQKHRRRAASVFEATGRENIRMLLGPHAVWGSITRYKMLLLAERVHEAHLQTVLHQALEEVDWAGEPAWEDDFSVISNKYGQRVRQFLFWWGGALAHLKWGQGEEEEEGEGEGVVVECCSPSAAAEEAGAHVSVVLPGEGAEVGLGAVAPDKEP